MRSTIPQLLSGGTRPILRHDGSEILFAGGDGGMVTDDRGVSYVDFILGFGPVSIGHANPEFNDRLWASLSGGLLLPGISVAHQQYCECIAAYYPGFTVAGFFKTGSESVTAAMRIAAAGTGKKGAVRCGHIGWHDAQIASTPHWHEPLGSSLRQRLRFTTAMRGVGPDEPVCNWSSLNISDLEDLLHGNSRWGAFVIDAYQISMTTPVTVSEALRLCRSRGMLTVLDETKTAGRLSPVGAVTEMVHLADLIILGKAIGNGAPISVLLVRDQIAADCALPRFGGTYSKGLFGVQSALITVELMQKRAGYSTLRKVGARAVETLNDAARRAGVAHHVTAVDSFGGTIFELRYDPLTVNNHAVRKRLAGLFQKHGILLMDGHCCFVCADHEQLDWDRLSDQSFCAFADWRRYCIDA